MIRVVLDTNVWLDWLLFDDPGVAPIRKAVAEGKAEIVMDEATEGELARVLGYTFNNKALDAAKQAELLEHCRRVIRRDEGGGLREEEKAVLPKCEDPDDQKFLELALASGAAFLVTRDGALLDLAEHKVRPLPYRIVTPAQLAQALRLVTR
jgi:putative PIN family toxin of toxin-antitoxin system